MPLQNCQKQAGSAFSTLAGIKKSDFKSTGEPKVFVDIATDSGASVERFFCGLVVHQYALLCHRNQISYI